MVSIKQLDPNEAQKLQATLKEAQEGRFYHWKRTYVLKVDGKVHSIVLNLFERLARLVMAVFGRNYFTQCFSGKDVTVLASSDLKAKKSKKPREKDCKKTNPNKNEKRTSSEKSMSEKDIIRIISHSNSRTSLNTNLNEVKHMMNEILKAAKDGKIQKEHFLDSDHSGFAIVAGNDLDSSLRMNLFLPTLKYMLLTDKIGFISRQRNGYKFSLDPKNDKNTKTNAHSDVFFNKDTLIKIDRYIKDNTIDTPADVPETIRLVVEHVIGEINAALFSRFSSAKEIVVLSSAEVARFGGLRKVTKAFDFLIQKGVIHSWLNQSRTRGIHVRLDVDDEFQQSGLASPWRGKSGLDAEAKFKEDNKIEIDDIKDTYTGDKQLLEEVVNLLNERTSNETYMLRSDTYAVNNGKKEVCAFLLKNKKIESYERVNGQHAVRVCFNTV